MEMEETFPHRSRDALTHVNTSIKQSRDFNMKRKTSTAHNKKSCLSESKKSHYCFKMRGVSINISHPRRNAKTLTQTHTRRLNSVAVWRRSLMMSFVLISLTSRLSAWHTDARDRYHLLLCQWHASENSADGWEIMTCTFLICHRSSAVLGWADTQHLHAITVGAIVYPPTFTMFWGKSDEKYFKMKYFFSGYQNYCTFNKSYAVRKIFFVLRLLGWYH